MEELNKLEHAEQLGYITKEEATKLARILLNVPEPVVEAPVEPAPAEQPAA